MCVRRRVGEQVCIACGVRASSCVGLRVGCAQGSARVGTCVDRWACVGRCVRLVQACVDTQVYAGATWASTCVGVRVDVGVHAGRHTRLHTGIRGCAGG